MAHCDGRFRRSTSTRQTPLATKKPIAFPFSRSFPSAGMRYHPQNSLSIAGHAIERTNNGHNSRLRLRKFKRLPEYDARKNLFFNLHERDTGGSPQFVILILQSPTSADSPFSVNVVEPFAVIANYWCWEGGKAPACRTYKLFHIT